MDASEVKPFSQWWLDWCHSLRSKPWRIGVSNRSYEKENARFEAGHVDPRDHRCIVDEPLQRDDPFSIWLIPEGNRQIGGLHAGKFKGKVTYATIPPRIISLPKPSSDRLPSDVGMPLGFITSLVDERVEAGLQRQAKVLLATKEAKATKALLPTIEAGSWNEVHIAFVSNDSIRIRSGNRDKTFSYAELGFKDSRKVDTPNSHWIVFHTLAECGEISWKIDVDQKTRNQAQKAIQAIRKTLKEITGLDDDPFENYRKVKAYRPKFKLVDKSYGGTGMLLTQANQENEEDDSDPEIQALMDEDINR